MTVAAVQDQTRVTSAESVALDAEKVSGDFLRQIPRDFARRHLVVSQGSEEDRELLAVAESTSPAVVYNTGVVLGREIRCCQADGEIIAKVIDDAYGVAADDIDSEQEATGDSASIDRLLQEADRDLLSTEGKGPVVKLVDALLFEALSRNASDVHVQPREGSALIRYRVDGVLQTVREVPSSLTGSIVSRIKVMARMDIAEKRIPQDGRATVTIGDRSRAGRAVDLRISTLPTSFGERAVIRLLDQRQGLWDFRKLEMPADTARRYLSCASRSNGIILITGPTGSGKTTTLYATLQEIGSPDLNIMTVEDPIEYDLSIGGLHISQSQVNLRKGVTFASGLRHILRQDPDVVMVGEIRDTETARIAIQSSLTGHLVFSTLHTNDAAGAVSRLFDLGIEPYLVSASLSAVLAQRLVRTIHQSCAGNGCELCLHSGYKGRCGLFELLVVDDQMRSLIGRGCSLEELRSAAKAAGMRTLFEEGRRLVAQGRTNDAEVARVTQEVLQ